MFGIDFKQYSTQSGFIKLAFGIVGAVGWWYGKDITALGVLYAMVAGFQGVASKA